MNDPGLALASQVLVQTALKLQPGERLVVIEDAQSFALGDAIASAAESRRPEPSRPAHRDRRSCGARHGRDVERADLLRGVCQAGSRVLVDGDVVVDAGRVVLPSRRKMPAVRVTTPPPAGG